MREIKQIKSKINYLLAILLAVAMLLALYFQIEEADNRHRFLNQSNVLNTADIDEPPAAPDQADTAEASVRHIVQAENTETDIPVQSAPVSEVLEIGYEVIAVDGVLQVYERSSHELYMETDIIYDYLPDQLKKEIDEGKYFVSEEALFEFLENYSS